MHASVHANARLTQLIAGAIVAAMATAAALSAQESKSPEIAPVDLVRATVRNEVATSEHREGSAHVPLVQQDA